MAIRFRSDHQKNRSQEPLVMLRSRRSGRSRPIAKSKMFRMNRSQLAAAAFGWLFLLPFLFSAAVGSSISRSEISVTDGHTILVVGEPVRLMGFNAPEFRDAQCAHEKWLGDAAKRRLQELVAGGDLDFTQVDCPCRPGTEGTPQCSDGHACGILRVRGRDVGAILITEGLAVPFVCGRTSCPKAPRPWCK
jgi:endonuclease YncB( thermonuclease family)